MKKKIGYLLVYLPLLMWLLFPFGGYLLIDLVIKLLLSGGMMSGLVVWVYLAYACGILYLLGFIGNLTRAIGRLRAADTKWQGLSSLLYLIVTIIAAIYGVMNSSLILMGIFLIKENFPFVLLIASFPILDYFSSLSEEEFTIPFLQSQKKINLKLALLVWAGLLIAAIGLPQIHREFVSYQKNRGIEESLQSLYQSYGYDYEVVVQSKEEGHARVVLSDQGVDLPVRIQFEEDRVSRKVEVLGTSFIDVRQGLNTLLEEKSKEIEAQETLKIYQSLVETLADDLSEEEQPAELEITFRTPEDYQLPEELVRLAQKNKKSDKAVLKAYEGYYGIDVETYMAYGLLMPAISLKNSSDYSTGYGLLENGDLSSLPDGSYLLNDQLYVVQDGQIIANQSMPISPKGLDKDGFEIDYYSLEEIEAARDSDGGRLTAKNTLSEEEIITAIESFYNQLGQKVTATVVAYLEGTQTVLAYLEQGKIRIPVRLGFENGQVISTTYEGDDSLYEHSIILRHFAESSESQRLRNHYKELVKQALAKTDHKAHLAVMDTGTIYSSYTGYRFWDLSEAILSEKASHRQSSDPVQSAFYGLGGLSVEDLIKSGALVVTVDLMTISDDFYYGWAEYQAAESEIFENLDTSQLSDGLYLLGGLAFQIKGGQVLNQTTSSPVDRSLIDLPATSNFDYLIQEEWEEPSLLFDELIKEVEE